MRANSSDIDHLFSIQIKAIIYLNVPNQKTKILLAL